MTQADAEGLIGALDVVKAAAPDETQAAMTKALTQLGDRGWPERAGHLSDALTVASRNGWSAGFRLKKAWLIHNEVADAAVLWQSLAGKLTDPSVDVAKLAQEIDDTVRPLLTAIVTDCSVLTDEDKARVELAERLKQMETNKAIDINVVLAPFIASPSERAAIITALANDGQFAGAIDVKQGLLYKVSPNPWFRLFTYLSPVLFFFVTAGLLIGISALHGVFGSGFPVQVWGVVRKPGGAAVFSWHKLLGPYLLVMAGVVAHLVVENIKQGQAGVQILAMNDLLTWLTLRWVGLALSYLPVIVVVVGLSVLGVGGSGHDLTLWLAAGYSVDSVAGLILNRFDTGSSALTAVNTIAKPVTAAAAK